jgi:hypothetical protein
MKTIITPLPYCEWFESQFNTYKAFNYMSDRSIDAYIKWRKQCLTPNKNQLYNTMNTEKHQQELIALIRQELANKDEFYRPSSYFHSVWFQPSSGRFLYADKYTRYEIVEPLIKNKTLVFKGIENHQDEKMLRYVLSE